MPVLVVANQKGGVGKTTLVFHLAWLLSEQGKKVLAIDLDPQSNLSWCFKQVDEGENCPASAIFESERILAEPIEDNLWLTSSGIGLARYEALGGGVNVFFRLRRALNKFFENVSIDWVLVDCPPSLGLFSLSALVAGDYLLIPLRTEVFSISGLGDLLKIVEEIKENVNKTLQIKGLVINAFASRTNVARVTLSELEEVSNELGAPLLTVIPSTVKMEEALRQGMPIWRYNPRHKIVRNIREAFEKIIKALEV